MGESSAENLKTARTPGAWAVRLAAGSERLAGRLRLCAGVRACQAEGALWLRGEEMDEPSDAILRLLAPTLRGRVLGDGALLPDGRNVPRGRVPDGPWLPLRDVLVLQPQVAALPGRVRAKVPLTLVEGGDESEPTILRAPWADWVAYAVNAAAVRLRSLQFACNGQEALVRGRPLPPLPGQRYVESGRVAVPCGWTLWPPVGSPVVASLLGLSEELALFKTEGSYERIHESAFVAAHRSAVRLTEKALAASLEGP